MGRWTSGGRGSLDPPRKSHHIYFFILSSWPFKTWTTDGGDLVLPPSRGAYGRGRGAGALIRMEGTTAAAWIVLFALSRNLRDFSPVTNCRPRLPACQPASQPASTPSRTRTRARGTKTSPPPSASAVPTVSNFPIAFWPRRRDLWALCKVGGIRSEFTQPLSTLCLRIISEYQLMLRARFVSSRFVISSFLPSFLPSLLPYSLAY